MRNRLNRKLVGMDDFVNRILLALSIRHPVLLYGPTGTGKTMISWEVAQRYVQALKDDHGITLPIIYLQLYPEMTKNSLIGGETLRDGTIVVEKQIVTARGADDTGALFLVDECTHTTEPVLLSFNSLIEEPYSTVIGRDEIVMHKNTRFIFSGNHPDHAGNIPLPISFANRLHIEDVQMPAEEVLVEIGKSINDQVPDEIIKFIVDIISKTNDPTFPVSPRNVIMCCKAVWAIRGTGWKNEGTIPNNLKKELKKLKMCPTTFKFTIMSCMMGHVKVKSTGPDKVAALLW